MNNPKHRKAEALRIYQLFWASYIRGDLESFASTLDEQFEMIGTSESEVAHNKAEGIEFYKAQMDEIVGKAEMRNRQISTKPIHDMILVNENCDIYVVVESKWIFYSKIRISTLLHETESGWKVIQQHGSLPDMRVQEGETLAIEKINRENLELRDAVMRRTIELEQKNRELEIEAALERVRTVAMGMKKPDDMLDVCQIISDQLNAFGVEQIRNVQTAIIDEEKGHYLCYQYFPSYEKTVVELTEYFKSPVEHEMVRRMLASKDGHFIGSIQGKELRDFADHRKEENHFSDPLLDQSQELSYCFLSIGKGGLGLSLYHELNQEVLDLFKRFHQVFTLAYRRFLDIQQAEAQAREAQIEVALEKVRSRSMGMQKSDELADLSLELVKQVQALGVETWFCAFNIYDENGEESIEWGSNGQATFPRYKTPRENVFLDYYKAGQSGETLLINEIAEEECPSHYEYLCSLPGVGDQLLKMKAAGISFPKYQIDHVAFFNYGYILFITYEPVPESHSVFKRFAQVFEQTYTRFLDLQRAEAQTRKSEIEVAVERVRAQSMAMHQPNDLNKVNKELLRQLQWLQVQGLSGVTFYLVEENGWVKSWDFSSPGNIGDQTSYTFQFDSNKHEMLGFPFKTLANTDLDYFIADYPLEKLKKALPELEEIDPSIAKIFTKAIETGALSHQWTACARISSGMLGVDLTIPPNEDTKTIVLKMAGAFNQAYTRFLDLKKAEAQAREAQIEAALERVRSRTMGMQMAEELGEVAAVLFSELNSLVENLWTCGFVLCEKDRQEDEWWLSLDNGLIRPFFLPNCGDYAHESLYEGWIKGESYRTVTLEGKLLQEHYDWLMEIPVSKKIFEEMEGSGIPRPNWQRLHAAYFKTGYLVIITEVPSEAEEIFKRFALVFDLAYTRFEDLKKAEARIREEKVKNALERVRSRSLAMHNSSELKDVIKTVSDQFKELEIDISGGAFIVINKELKKGFYCWGAGGVGNYVRKVKIPFIDRPIYHTLSNGIKTRKPFFTEYYEQEEKHAFFSHLFKHEPFNQTPIQRQEFLLSQNSAYARSCVVSEKTSIFIINHEGRPFSEAENEFLIQMGRVFEQAYTRFIDLKKTEKQARLISSERDRLEVTLNELKATQAQLIQQEKLASLGELTAGIAHEIQNPLNFVNNFSEVSEELIDELKEEIEKGDLEEVKSIASDLKENLSKINHHGKRAGAIVKGMLEHSRKSEGTKTLTDLSSLAEEYLRLSFHGLRAKDKSFSSDFFTEFAPDLPKVSIIQQDIGRVLLNLINNAFYAVHEFRKTQDENFKPIVIVKSSHNQKEVELSVSDNGSGIPEHILDKIFQPFFTTKPTGEGTGLGLSLSYDIIKAHGGKLSVRNLPGSGAEFKISLPKNSFSHG